MRARSPQAFLLTFYHMMCRGRDMKVEVDAPRSSRNVTWRQFKDFLTVFFYLQLAVMAGKLLLTRGPIISGVLALVLTKPVRVMLGHNVGCFLCDYYLQVPPAQTRRPCATNRAHGGARLGGEVGERELLEARHHLHGNGLARRREQRLFERVLWIKV